MKVKGKTLLLVCEANADGVLEALTFFPIADVKHLNKKVRVGKLMAFERARGGAGTAGTTVEP